MYSRKFLSLLLVLFLGISFASAQGVTFSKETFTDAGITLPYRKAMVLGAEEKASLVIYLHGGSSKGNDNETQMNEPGINSISTWLLNQKRKSIMLVPQCPKDKSWTGPMLDVLKNLLQSYVDKGVVDNVYIFGGSMGELVRGICLPAILVSLQQLCLWLAILWDWLQNVLARHLFIQ